MFVIDKQYMFSNKTINCSKGHILRVVYSRVSKCSNTYTLDYNILLSIMTYKYSARLKFTLIFGKKLFLFFKNNITIINPCKRIHHESHLKHFLSYLPCIVRIEYFSIIFKIKKCALYSIKYGNLPITGSPVTNTLAYFVAEFF